MQYLVIETDKVVAVFLSLRSALNYVEEFIAGEREKIQGEMKEVVVKTMTSNVSGSFYSESWNCHRPYGFFVQTFSDNWLKWVCFHRERTVGYFYNTYFDRKLLTLQIVGQKIAVNTTIAHPLTNSVAKLLFLDDIKKMNKVGDPDD